MVIDDLEEQHAADVIRARAREHAADVIERADDLIAAPRYGAESAAAYEALARERAKPFVTKRAPEPTVYKTKTQEPAPTAPASGYATPKFVKWSELTNLCKTIADTIDRIVGDTQAALDRRDVRIRDLEARLAQTEGRLADVESRKSKK